MLVNSINFKRKRLIFHSYQFNIDYALNFSEIALRLTPRVQINHA